MNSLSEVQQKAVTHRDGPMLVLAGPGSGKTMVLTRRVQYLTEICHIPPGEILVITFTKAAAREMKERYLREYGCFFWYLSRGLFPDPEAGLRLSGRQYSPGDRKISVPA